MLQSVEKGEKYNKKISWGKRKTIEDKRRLAFQDKLVNKVNGKNENVKRVIN